MDANAKAAPEKIAELAALVRRIREEVARAHPTAGANGLRLADLLPAVHARDAAEGKAGAIGQVNPRPPGLLNDAIQAVKRGIARLLGWFVREQEYFNRACLRCIDALIEAMNESNRAQAELSGRLAGLAEQLDAAAGALEEARDLSRYFAEWRTEWERKWDRLELHWRREAAGALAHARAAESGLQAQVAAAQQSFLAALERQHADFRRELDSGLTRIQQQMWKELEQLNMQVSARLEREARQIRQRALLLAHLPSAGREEPPPAPPPLFDGLRFSEKFRGPEEAVRRRMERYVPLFAGRKPVLDLGCGRGEFLELMRAAGAEAKGVDSSGVAVAICRQKGLAAEAADLFAYLEAEFDGSLGGIFCSHVIEHLPSEQVLRLVMLAARKLAPAAPILFETPNPECLAIFATHFYLDPTHVRPVPAALMAFYLEEAGLTGITIERLEPARNSLPGLDHLPAEFRDAFFGGLDYAICARKP